MAARTLAPALLSLALSATALAADDAPGWSLEVNDHGLRRATAHGTATWGATQVPATLQLMCRSGEDGTVSWTLAVERSSELVGFDFGAFEGPDAPTNEKMLSRLDLDGGILRTGFATATTGAYVDGARFAFQFSAPATAASQAGLLAEAVDETSEAIRWAVTSPERADAKLEAEFSAEGAAPVLRDAMLGCGPPPALDDARIAGWLGRNPHSTGFFGQRAVAWRTHALLGSAHDAVLARFARAQPVARDGNVLFVLAPDAKDERSGAVLMLELGGTDATVIEIDDGKVERRTSASADAPIVPPAAVREFVAKRSGV